MKQHTVQCIDIVMHESCLVPVLQLLSVLYSLTKIIASIGATKPKIVPSSTESQQLLTQNTVNNKMYINKIIFKCPILLF